MNKTELKELLEGEIKKTKEKISDYSEMSNPVAPDNAIGRVSRMDAINNKSINDAALLKAEEKLKALRYALSRTDDTDFGKCARCGSEIPVQRILLVPQSRFCVNCAGR